MRGVKVHLYMRRDKADDILRVEEFIRGRLDHSHIGLLDVSIIHGDAHCENVILSKTGATWLDFEDICEGMRDRERDPCGRGAFHSPAQCQPSHI